ncbi:hypothetical protein QFC21_000765 [Naganishia friedmannii]|uniref:Uncharacterized protein n=1 Tax=Naganishia friedmannii TaxID=89922 RepID=A0ACC2W7N2_9TREE|nr:hypothetical protein QFC21_000765 [Naganishia friedmannii]
MFHPFPSTYTAHFSQPPSLHPTIHIRHLPAGTPPPPPNDHPLPHCRRHTLVYLNDRLFIDPYELEDRWGAGNVLFPEDNGKNHVAAADEPKTRLVDERHTAPPAQTRRITWSLTPGTPDLERPVRYGFTRRLAAAPRIYSSNNASSSSLSTTSYNPQSYPPESVLHIIHHSPPCQNPLSPPSRSPPPSPPPPSDSISTSWYDLAIPTHMRYQEPTSSGGGYRTVLLSDIEKDASLGTAGGGGGRGGEHAADTNGDVLVHVYWSCTLEEADGLTPDDDDNHTGNDTQNPALPHKITQQLRLLPGTATNPHTLHVPTAIASHITFVPPLTLLAVFLAWMYLSSALYRVFKRSLRRRQVEKSR